MAISTWTVNEAANHLKMEPNQVIKGLEAGDLPGMKVGEAWRVLPEPLFEKVARISNEFQNKPVVNPESKSKQLWDGISKVWLITLLTNQLSEYFEMPPIDSL